MAWIVPVRTVRFDPVVGDDAGEALDDVAQLDGDVGPPVAGSAVHPGAF